MNAYNNPCNRKESGMKLFKIAYCSVMICLLFAITAFAKKEKIWTSDPPIQLGAIMVSPNVRVCAGTKVALRLDAVDMDTRHICIDSETEAREFQDTTLRLDWLVRKDGTDYAVENGKNPNAPFKFIPKETGYYDIEIIADDNPEDPDRNDDPVTSKITIIALKVEFLDKDKNETTSLKVGKWKDAFQGDPATAVKNNFIDLDPDRFYIRVNDQSKKGSGKISINLSTDSPGTDYDDDATEIELTETGANTDIFESKSLMIMSGDVDDDHQVDSIADDAKNDRTHKVALDATVEVEHPTTDPICTKTATASADKTVTFHVNILKVGGTGVVNNAAVQGDMKQIAERYAQMQIKVDYTIEDPVDPPTGVNLSDGLDEYPGVVGGVIQMTDEEKSLLGASALRTATDDDIELYYVNNLSLGSLGESFWKSAVPDPKYKNSMVLAVGRFPYVVPAHEAGHVILDSGDHYTGANKEQNLMSDGAYGTGSSHTVLSQKRVTETQANSFRTSSLAK